MNNNENKSHLRHAVFKPSKLSTQAQKSNRRFLFALYSNFLIQTKHASQQD